MRYLWSPCTTALITAKAPKRAIEDVERAAKSLFPRVSANGCRDIRRLVLLPQDLKELFQHLPGLVAISDRAHVVAKSQSARSFFRRGGTVHREHNRIGANQVGM